jgi:hypothetical protein
LHSLVTAIHGQPSFVKTMMLSPKALYTIRVRSLIEFRKIRLVTEQTRMEKATSDHPVHQSGCLGHSSCRVQVLEKPSPKWMNISHGTIQARLSLDISNTGQGGCLDTSTQIHHTPSRLHKQTEPVQTPLQQWLLPQLLGFNILSLGRAHYIPIGLIALARCRVA